MIIKIGNTRKKLKTYSINAINGKLGEKLAKKTTANIRNIIKKYKYFVEIFPTDIVKKNSDVFREVNKKLNECYYKYNVNKKNKMASQYIGRIFQYVIHSDNNIKYIEYSKEGYRKGNKAYIKVK